MSRERASGIAQSVQARLQAKANREDRPYAELLQLYGIERFLYRLARSEHRDSLILKGAYLLKVWLGLNSRPTRDIDLLGPLGVDEQAVRQLLRDIVATEVESDGLEPDVESIVVRRIRLGSPVHGMRAKFDGIALTAAIRATFEKRESSVSDALEVLRGSSVLQKKSVLWGAFLRKSRLAEQTSLDKVLRKIREFVEPPARAVIADRSFEMLWPAGGLWILRR